MFRGMGRVYEEFTYSIPNLILLGITLPAARWIEGRWTPFGIGVAVAVATAGSACVLMGRVLFVLHLPLTRFLRVVIVPGLAPYAIAGCPGLAGGATGGHDEPLAGSGRAAGGRDFVRSGRDCSIESLGADGRREAKGNRVVPPGPGNAPGQGGNGMNRRMYIAALLPWVLAGLPRRHRRNRRCRPAGSAAGRHNSGQQRTGVEAQSAGDSAQL